MLSHQHLIKTPDPSCQHQGVAGETEPVGFGVGGFGEECRKRWEAAQSSFCKTIECKIGNTWYVIETECDGNEPLTDKVKRLIFSDKGVIC